MIDWVTRRLLAQRGRVLLLVGVATLIAAIASLGVRFDFTPQAVFSGEDELVAHSEQFKAAFGYEDSVLLIVIESTGQADVLSRELLNWQLRVERVLHASPFVTDVVALPTLRVPHRSLFAKGGVTMAPVVRVVPVDDAEQRRIRQAVDYYGTFDRFLLSPDRRVSAVLVKLDPARRDIAGLQKAVRSVRAVLDDHPVPTGYRASLGGLPALRVRVVEDLKRGQLWLVPMAGLAFAAVLAVGFRNWSGAMLPLVAVGAGLSWTVAILAAAGIPIGIINNILPVLLFAIGVSNSVHFVARYREESRRHAGDARRAATETLRGMIPACLLTYGTTAVGFLSLLAARSDELRGLGWQACVGLSLCYVSTIAVLGAALPLFRGRASADSDAAATRWAVNRSLAAGAALVVNHPRQVVLIAGLLLVAAVAASLQIRVNSQTMEAYAPSHPFSRQMQTIEDRLSGYLSLEIDLSAAAAATFQQPDVIRAIMALETAVSQEAGVLQIVSYVDLYEQAFSSFRNQPRVRQPFPAADAVARDRIALSRRLLASAGEQSGLRHFLSPDGRRARIMIRVRDIGTRRTLGLIAAVEDQLQARFPQDGAVRYRLTGDAYLMAVVMDRFVRDLLVSLGGATAIVFGLMALLFRSFRYGLITIPPNLTPLILTLGYMSWRGYDMNIAHVIVFSISLGVAVDNTIHFVTRFREELRQGRTDAQAVRAALASTGRAIVFTSLIMLAGLAVLAASSFLPTRHFAELMGVTMVAALLGDLLLLPACLLLAKPGRPAAADSP